MKQSDYILSPLNYIGGKCKLLPQLLPLFPQKINTFVDLFCGGCNVGINVQAEKVVFNDNLCYLIDLYREFQKQDTQAIIQYVETRITELGLSLTNEQAYLELRKQYNEKRNPLDLFVLVAYSFNHQIRFNNSHEFNNPFGRERSCYNERMKGNLVRFVDALHAKNTMFSCGDFTALNLSALGENDFVYADPPYLITTGTYNDGKRGFTGWGEKQEEQLLELLTALQDKGVKFALSNVLVHKGKQNALLLDWISANNLVISPMQMSYKNSNYQKGKADEGTCEVVITNYAPANKQVIRPQFETEERTLFGEHLMARIRAFR